MLKIALLGASALVFALGVASVAAPISNGHSNPQFSAAETASTNASRQAVYRGPDATAESARPAVPLFTALRPMNDNLFRPPVQRLGAPTLISFPSV